MMHTLLRNNKLIANNVVRLNWDDMAERWVCVYPLPTAKKRGKKVRYPTATRSKLETAVALLELVDGILKENWKEFYGQLIKDRFFLNRKPKTLSPVFVMSGGGENQRHIFKFAFVHRDDKGDCHTYARVATEKYWRDAFREVRKFKRDYYSPIKGILAFVGENHDWDRLEPTKEEEEKILACLAEIKEKNKTWVRSCL